MAAPSDDEEGREWEYSLEDLAEDDAEGAASEDGEDGGEGFEAIDRSIDPEEIDLENAAFVALGALVGVLVIVRTAMVFTG